MTGLGRLIRMLREAGQMTRSELAEGICSVKYIYFIEKGARTPSAEIINAIGVKLKQDIFEYLPYLDCGDPILVKNGMDTFEKLRNATDYKQLGVVTSAYENLGDFQQLPWRAEITFNQIMVALFDNNTDTRLKQAIESEINRLGGKLPPQENGTQEMGLQLIRFYNLLAVYEFTHQHLEQGYNCLDYVYEQLRPRRQIRQFQSIYESVALNYLNTLVIRQRYEDLSQGTVELLDYQLQNNRHGRVYLTYFLMAQGAYEQNRSDLAVLYLRKCLYLGLTIGSIKHLKALMDYCFVKKLQAEGHLKIDLREEFESLSQ